MAALGGVLGALLLLALIALVTLVHKHYGSRLKCCSGKALVRPWGRGAGPERDRWGERDQGGGGKETDVRVRTGADGGGGRRGAGARRCGVAARARGWVRTERRGEAGLSARGDRFDAPAPPPAPQEPPPGGFDNKAFLVDPEANWAPGAGPSPGGTAPAAQSPGPPLPAPPASPSPATADLVPEAPAAAGDGDGPAGVRSILTKERRPEGGYKAVWFGEDIGAEADVVVLDTPASDADGAGAEGSAGSADEDEDEDAAAGLGGGPDAADADEAPGAGATYI